MAEKRKLARSPTKDSDRNRAAANADLHQPIEFSNVNLPIENSTADQAFFLQDFATPYASKYYDAHSSEEDSAYGQDKDFESISNEKLLNNNYNCNNNVPEFDNHLKQQLLQVNDQQQLYNNNNNRHLQQQLLFDDETPHGQSMEENISPELQHDVDGLDDTGQTFVPQNNTQDKVLLPLQQQNVDSKQQNLSQQQKQLQQYPLKTQPFVRSSGNINTGGAATTQKTKLSTSNDRKGTQNQHQLPRQSQTNIMMTAAYSQNPTTQKSNNVKAVGKATTSGAGVGVSGVSGASAALKNGNSNKLDKSQQIRNSYNRFMAGQHAQGTNSQRPTANQPAFFAASGNTASVQNPLAEPVMQSRPNRRTKNTKNAAAGRSRTVKPQIEAVAAAMGIKTSSMPNQTGGGTTGAIVHGPVAQSASGATGGAATTANAQMQVVSGSMSANTKNVDLLVIGAGPASLGFLVSAVKQQKFGEILQDDGLAILDTGISLGGGMLCNYGINSNTSANSFLKCIFRKSKEKNATNAAMNALQAAIAAQANHATTANALNKDTAKNAKRRQKSVGKERVNQHQQATTNKPQSSVAIDTAQIGATKPTRERQMSPVIHQKWVLNNNTASNRNHPKQSQQHQQATAAAVTDESQQHHQQQEDQQQHKMAASKKMFEKVVASNTRVQEDENIDDEDNHPAIITEAIQAQAIDNVVGQPQDPDMEELPICLTSSGEKDKTDNITPKEHDENADEAVNLQNLCTEDLIQTVSVKGNLQPQSNLQLPVYQDALQAEPTQLQNNEAAALQDGRQPKKAMRRKKSRDEQSAAGRNSRKQQQVSSVNRQQASGALKVNGMTTTMAQKQSNLKTAAQTSLAIYAQQTTMLQTPGPNNNKALLTKIIADTVAKVWTSDDVLTPFKEIFTSNISQLFRKMAKNIVPLSLVGHLLNYVGNHLLHYAYKSTGKRIYMPKHRAMSIHLMGNGEIVTQVLKTDFQIIPDPTKSPPTFQVVEGKQSIVYFRSKAVVIAGGAQQGLDQRITSEWFPNLNPEKLIASDTFLKKQEYLSQIERLRALKRPPKIVIIGGSHSGFSCAWLLLNGPAMYNRCYKTLNNSEQQPSAAASKDQPAQPPSTTAPNAAPKIPYAFRKQIKNCIPCCTCGNSVLIASQKLAAQNAGGNTQNQRYLEELRSQSKAGSRVPRGLSVAARELSPINKNGRHLSKTVKQRKDLVTLKQQNFGGNGAVEQLGNKGPGGLYSVMSPESKIAKILPDQAPVVEATAVDAQACSCVCKCLGYFKYDEWPNLDSATNPLELPEFGDGDIKILYRDRIKVFFKSEKEAHEAGYTDFDVLERQKKKKDGYVYSFTGLRGDAKQLYLRVTSREEKRVNFVRAETPELQRIHVEAADLVIWACGYQSNAIKIHDVNKKELALSQKVPNTQYDIDGKNRIILSDGNVLNKVFACGVGFPVRTKDGGVGNADPSKNPRADSFSLYMHTVGEVLLKSLLPKKKIAGIVSHKEVANPYLKAATYEQIMKDKQHKNKKPLLQQVSTKKERNTSKLSQLVTGINPITKLQQKGNVPLDLVDNQAFMHNEMSNVYLSYLQTAKPGNKINMKLKPPGLNSDLEDLSGFGLISAHASKTNCFSHRAELDAIQEPANEHALMQQTTSFFQEGRNQFKYRDESADIEDDKINAVLKFPEIKRETPFVSSSQPVTSGETNGVAVNSSKQYNSLNQQSLSSLSNQVEQQQLHYPHQSGTDQLLQHQQQMIEEDFNDREPITLSANNFIPQSQCAAPGAFIAEQKLLLDCQLQQQLQQQQTTQDSNKSIDQPQVMITNASRNNQVLTSSITGKSPLLLQKKQQMIIQKTKEPLSTHAIIQQTAAHHQQSQNIATMSGLKTTGSTSGKNTGTSQKNNAAGGAKGNAGKNIIGQSNTSKPDRKTVMHTQDLFKKHHNQVLAAVDQSPYMQFGVQHQTTQNDHGVKQRNNNASKTQKVTGATVKRNFMEKSSTSTAAQNQVVREGGVKDVGMGIYNKNNVHQNSQAVGGGKSSTGGRHPPPQQNKDSISTMIQQNQKAFSEREQNMHARYKAVNVSGITGGNKPQKEAGGVVRKEHLASVDVSKSSGGGNIDGTQTHFKLQQLSGSETGVLAMKDVRETFAQHNKSQQQNLNQGMYSVKSLASNSDLFPPITNKLQDLSLSSTISGGKHKRLASSSTNNNNDSVRSLHLSSHQVSTSIRQKHSSISAQKAAAVLSQQKSSGLVYAPAVCQQTAVNNHRNRQTQGSYLANSGAAAARAQNTTATQNKQNVTGGTYQQVQHTASQATQQQKLVSAMSTNGHQQNRTSLSSKKKNMTNLTINGNSQTQQPQTLETTLSHNGLIVPLSTLVNGDALQKNFNSKKVLECSALTSPQPEPSKPDLCEMGVNDISLRLLQSGAKQALGDKEDDMGLRQAIEDELLQPESSRTTVIEISEHDENYQTYSKTLLGASQEDEEANLMIPRELIESIETLQKKHMSEEKSSSQVTAPKIIQQSGNGNNHFKAAKKMSQNTHSGTYGDLVAAFSASVAANTPYLRQPSQIHQPKSGDLDHLDQQVKNSHYTSQTIERKDSGPEIAKHTVSKKVEQLLNPKASNIKSLANKSPTPHKSSSNPNTTAANKFQQYQQRSARRHTGAISATDLQALEKTPRGSGGLKGRQSIGANSVKRPLNSVGLFDKFIGEGSNKQHQVIQPYLEQAHQQTQSQADTSKLVSSGYKKAAAVDHHHQPTGSTAAARKNHNHHHHERHQQQNAQSSALRQANYRQAMHESIKNTKQSGAKQDTGRPAGKTGGSKLANHQRSDVSPAKIDADNHGILDKAQLESNPVAARLLISSVPPANDASNLNYKVDEHEQSSALTAQHSVSVFTLASQSTNQLAVASDPTKKPMIESTVPVPTSAFQIVSNRAAEQQLQTTKMMMMESQNKSSVTPGYRKAAVASGFFVHKTIRDLEISADPADQVTRQQQLVESKDTGAELPNNEITHDQKIKAIKKEVQSKVANLSPVLKKRGQSKVNLGIGQGGSKTQQNHHQTPGGQNQQLNTSKYRSPIRTTLKSAVSSSIKDGGNTRQVVNSNTGALGAGSSMIGVAGSGRSVRQSHTLKLNHQAGMAQQQQQSQMQHIQRVSAQETSNVNHV